MAEKAVLTKELKSCIVLDGKILDGEEAYKGIFSGARESIILIDDRIGLKTLELLGAAEKSIPVLLYSDNTDPEEKLTREKLKRFFSNHPSRNLLIRTTAGKYHDRYIIVDHETETEKIYRCGASVLDAGKKLSSILTVRDRAGVSAMLADLETNSYLLLK